MIICFYIFVALISNLHRFPFLIMVDAVEYRSVIKFLFLQNVPTENIIDELRNGYGDSCPSLATIYRWIGYFKGGVNIGL